MIATDVPVLVFSTADSGLAHLGLAVARSLGRLGIAVHLLHGGRAAASRASRYIRSATALRRHDIAGERWLEVLTQLARRLWRPLLIPTDDRACYLISQRREALRPWVGLMDQPPELLGKLIDKRRLHQLCTRLGLPTLPTFFPGNRRELASLTSALTFPVVVKPVNQLQVGWSAEARRPSLVGSAAELDRRFGARLETAAPNLLVQEHLPAAAGLRWIFNGYFDARSAGLVSSTGRKLRLYPPEVGVATLVEWAPNPTASQQCRDLLQSVDYHGAVDVDLLYDARRQRFCIVDVNPRLGAPFRTFVARQGLDLAQTIYCDLTGQPTSPIQPRFGRRWVQENLDILAVLRGWRRGCLGLLEWSRSLRGVQETAWFARDDPAPFIIMCALMAAASNRRLRGT